MNTSKRQILTVLTMLVAIAVTPRTRTDANETVYENAVRSTTLVMTNGGRGSGALVDIDRKLVVTNYHVIRGNQFVDVIFPMFEDGVVVSNPADYDANKKTSRVRGKVISADPKRDLALIEVERIPEDAVAIELAPTSARPGQLAHAIGNPLASGAIWVYTFGRVRQVYRKSMNMDEGLTCEMTVVETQAPVNPGDSGGPLVNEKGQLIGITQGYHPEFRMYSYAVDIQEIKSLLKGENSSVDTRLAKVMSGTKFPFTVGTKGEFRLKLNLKDSRELPVNIRSQTEMVKDKEVRGIFCPVRSWAPENLSEETIEHVKKLCSVNNPNIWRWVDFEGQRLLLMEGTLDASCDLAALESSLVFIANEVRRVHGDIEAFEHKQNFEAIAPRLPGLIALLS